MRSWLAIFVCTAVCSQILATGGETSEGVRILGGRVVDQETGRLIESTGKLLVDVPELQDARVPRADSRISSNGRKRDDLAVESSIGRDFWSPRP